MISDDKLYYAEEEEQEEEDTQKVKNAERVSVSSVDLQTGNPCYGASHLRTGLTLCQY